MPRRLWLHTLVIGNNAQVYYTGGKVPIVGIPGMKLKSNGHGKRIADIGSRSCAPVRCCRKVAVHLQALQVAGHPGTGQVGRVCNVFVFFAGCHKKGKRQGSKQYHFFHNLFCLVLKRKEMQQQTGRQCAAK